MRTQKVYHEPRGLDRLTPDRVYAATARFYVALKNERDFNLNVIVGAFNNLLVRKPWKDELVAVGSSEFSVPHTRAHMYTGDFVYCDEKEPYYFELYAIPRLKKGQLLALEKWAESFAKALLFEEIPGMAISSTRAEVSFRRTFGTFRRQD